MQDLVSNESNCDDYIGTSISLLSAFCTKYFPHVEEIETICRLYGTNVFNSDILGPRIQTCLDSGVTVHSPGLGGLSIRKLIVEKIKDRATQFQIAIHSLQELLSLALCEILVVLRAPLVPEQSHCQDSTGNCHDPGARSVALLKELDLLFIDYNTSITSAESTPRALEHILSQLIQRKQSQANKFENHFWPRQKEFNNKFAVFTSLLVSGLQKMSQIEQELIQKNQLSLDGVLPHRESDQSHSLEAEVEDKSTHHETLKRDISTSAALPTVAPSSSQFVGAAARRRIAEYIYNGLPGNVHHLTKTKLSNQFLIANMSDVASNIQNLFNSDASQGNSLARVMANHAAAIQVMVPESIWLSTTYMSNKAVSDSTEPNDIERKSKALCELLPRKKIQGIVEHSLNNHFEFTSQDASLSGNHAGLGWILQPLPENVLAYMSTKFEDIDVDQCAIRRIGCGYRLIRKANLVEDIKSLEVQSGVTAVVPVHVDDLRENSTTSSETTRLVQAHQIDLELQQHNLKEPPRRRSARLKSNHIRGYSTTENVSTCVVGNDVEVDRDTISVESSDAVSAVQDAFVTWLGQEQYFPSLILRNFHTNKCRNFTIDELLNFDGLLVIFEQGESETINADNARHSDMNCMMGPSVQQLEQPIFEQGRWSHAIFKDLLKLTFEKQQHMMYYASKYWCNRLCTLLKKGKAKCKIHTYKISEVEAIEHSDWGTKRFEKNHRVDQIQPPPPPIIIPSQDSYLQEMREGTCHFSASTDLTRTRAAEDPLTLSTSPLLLPNFNTLDREWATLTVDQKNACFCSCYSFFRDMKLLLKEKAKSTTCAESSHDTNISNLVYDDEVVEDLHITDSDVENIEKKSQNRESTYTISQFYKIWASASIVLPLDITLLEEHYQQQVQSVNQSVPNVEEEESTTFKKTVVNGYKYNTDDFYHVDTSTKTIKTQNTDIIWKSFGAGNGSLTNLSGIYNNQDMNFRDRSDAAPKKNSCSCSFAAPEEVVFQSNLKTFFGKHAYKQETEESQSNHDVFESNVSNPLSKAGFEGIIAKIGACTFQHELLDLLSFPRSGIPLIVTRNWIGTNAHGIDGVDGLNDTVEKRVFHLAHVYSNGFHLGNCSDSPSAKVVRFLNEKAGMVDERQCVMCEAMPVNTSFFSKYIENGCCTLTRKHSNHLDVEDLPPMRQQFEDNSKQYSVISDRLSEPLQPPEGKQSQFQVSPIASMTSTTTTTPEELSVLHNHDSSESNAVDQHAKKNDANGRESPLVDDWGDDDRLSLELLDDPSKISHPISSCSFDNRREEIRKSTKSVSSSDATNASNTAAEMNETMIAATKLHKLNRHACVLRYLTITLLAQIQLARLNENRGGKQRRQGSIHLFLSPLGNHAVEVLNFALNLERNARTAWFFDLLSSGLIQIPNELDCPHPNKVRYARTVESMYASRNKIYNRTAEVYNFFNTGRGFRESKKKFAMQLARLHEGYNASRLEAKNLKLMQLVTPIIETEIEAFAKKMRQLLQMDRTTVTSERREDDLISKHDHHDLVRDDRVWNYRRIPLHKGSAKVVLQLLLNEFVNESDFSSRISDLQKRKRAEDAVAAKTTTGTTTNYGSVNDYSTETFYEGENALAADDNDGMSVFTGHASQHKGIQTQVCQGQAPASSNSSRGKYKKERSMILFSKSHRRRFLNTCYETACSLLSQSSELREKWLLKLSLTKTKRQKPGWKSRFCARFQRATRFALNEIKNDVVKGILAAFKSTNTEEDVFKFLFAFQDDEETATIDLTVLQELLVADSINIHCDREECNITCDANFNDLAGPAQVENHDIASVICHNGVLRKVPASLKKKGEQIRFVELETECNNFQVAEVMKQKQFGDRKDIKSGNSKKKKDTSNYNRSQVASCSDFYFVPKVPIVKIVPEAGFTTGFALFSNRVCVEIIQESINDFLCEENIRDLDSKCLKSLHTNSPQSKTMPSQMDMKYHYDIMTDTAAAQETGEMRDVYARILQASFRAGLQNQKSKFTATHGNMMVFDEFISNACGLISKDKHKEEWHQNCIKGLFDLGRFFHKGFSHAAFCIRSDGYGIHLFGNRDTKNKKSSGKKGKVNSAVTNSTFSSRANEDYSTTVAPARTIGIDQGKGSSVAVCMPKQVEDAIIEFTKAKAKVVHESEFVIKTATQDVLKAQKDLPSDSKLQLDNPLDFTVTDEVDGAAVTEPKACSCRPSCKSPGSVTYEEEVYVAAMQKLRDAKKELLVATKMLEEVTWSGEQVDELLRGDRRKGVNCVTRKQRAREMKEREMAFAREKRLNIFNHCLHNGWTVQKLVKNRPQLHANSTIEAAKIRLKLLPLLLIAYNSSEVHQQRRERDKLKRSYTSRHLRLITLHLPMAVDKGAVVEGDKDPPVFLQKNLTFPPRSPYSRAREHRNGAIRGSRELLLPSNESEYADGQRPSDLYPNLVVYIDKCPTKGQKTSSSYNYAGQLISLAKHLRSRRYLSKRISLKVINGFRSSKQAAGLRCYLTDSEKQIDHRPIKVTDLYSGFKGPMPSQFYHLVCPVTGHIVRRDTPACNNANIIGLCSDLKAPHPKIFSPPIERV